MNQTNCESLAFQLTFYKNETTSRLSSIFKQSKYKLLEIKMAIPHVLDESGAKIVAEILPFLTQEPLKTSSVSLA